MTNPEAESFTKWSVLPKELLDLILSKMSPITILNFRAVCSSWGSAAKAYISSPLYNQEINQVPWLMLPPKQENDTHISFFSLEDKKAYKRLNRPRKLGNGLCLGSSHGWLVMLGEKVELYLLNPFTFAQIPLPLLETFPDIVSISISDGNSYELEVTDSSPGPTGIRRIKSLKELRRGGFISKAVLSSNPSHNSEFFVLLIFNLGSYWQSQLAFCSSGDSNWMRLGEFNCSYTDVICYDDKFFALNGTWHVEIWDIIDSSPILRANIDVSFPESIIVTEYPIKDYLVESSGDLLLVKRYDGFSYDEELFRIRGESMCMTLCFRVFKINFTLMEWEEVESISDFVLFLGVNQSLSLPIRDIPVCKANSIYFTDDHFGERICGHDMPYDIGVYNMEEKSVRSFFQCDLPKTEPPPIWIDPSALLD